jgi:uncharacterized SAM-binding protein YcdF (DUF218 family)
LKIKHQLLKAKTSIIQKLWKGIKILIFSFGITFIILIAGAFTSLPYWMHYHLGTSNSAYAFEPKYIIMLGGSGMPSEDNIYRLYFTAHLANKYPNSKIIIAHPHNTQTNKAMLHELVLRGVDSTRITFEGKGTNTRSQATNTALKYPNTRNAEVVLVSSPEHMYRSIMVFKKAGFNKIGGNSTLEIDLTNETISFESYKIGGKKYIPDVGKSFGLRYNLWSYLNFELICFREYAAIVYYKLNGWI